MLVQWFPTGDLRYTWIPCGGKGCRISSNFGPLISSLNQGLRTFHLILKLSSNHVAKQKRLTKHKNQMSLSIMN